MKSDGIETIQKEGRVTEQRYFFIPENQKTIVNTTFLLFAIFALCRMRHAGVIAEE